MEDDHTSGMVESGDENDQGQGQVNLCMKIAWEKDTRELPLKRFRPALTMEKPDEIIWKTSYRNDLVTLWQQRLVNTKYKRKGEKVLPVNQPDPNGPKAPADTDWREKVLRRYYKSEWSRPVPAPGWYGGHVIPKISGIARGARLTPERVDRLKLGELWHREREFLLEVLYAREAALAWSFFETGRVREEVCPPVFIKTIPHEPWQDKGFPVPRALKQVAAKMVQERMENKVLEYATSLYLN